MSYNMQGTFSNNIEKVIKNDKKIALRFGSDVVGTEHILYGLTTVKESIASTLLSQYGVSEEKLFELLEENSIGQRILGGVELSTREKDI